MRPSRHCRTFDCDTAVVDSTPTQGKGCIKIIIMFCLGRQKAAKNFADNTQNWAESRKINGLTG